MAPRCVPNLNGGRRDGHLDVCRLAALAASIAFLSIACGGDDNIADRVIVFVAGGNEDRSDIFSVDSATGEIINLTDNPAHDFNAVRSPDGSKIAFFSTRMDEPDVIEDADLYVMKAEGYDVELVAELESLAPVHNRRLVWNNESDGLVYQDTAGQPIFVDLNGPDSDPPVVSDVGPVWSYDGERIIFAADDTNGAGLALWALQPHTGQRELLASVSEDQSDDCDWPPMTHDPKLGVLLGLAFYQPIGIQPYKTTGEALYVAGVCYDGELHEELAVAGPRRSQNSLITGDGLRKFDVRWSPDGLQIAYVAWVDDGLPSIWVVDKSGDSSTLVAEGAGQPEWSPDGTRLAFVGTISPGSRNIDDIALFVARSDGSDRQVLVEGGVGAITHVNW